MPMGISSNDTCTNPSTHLTRVQSATSPPYITPDPHGSPSTSFKARGQKIHSNRFCPFPPNLSCCLSFFFLFSCLLSPIPFLPTASVPLINPINQVQLSYQNNMMNGGMAVEEAMAEYHTCEKPSGKCGSMHMQHITAPPAVVWSLVRRFDKPQAYKRFIRSCHLISGNGGVGSVREVRVVSGLPADTSTERLDELDDGKRLMRFSIVGGDHRLKNYRSTTTVHVGDGGSTAIVVESYTVDVPVGSTAEETCIFADTIVGCNLKSLAEVAERMAR